MTWVRRKRLLKQEGSQEAMVGGNWWSEVVIRIELSWVPVAHACNPSYSGGRDQDFSLKLIRANSS
jgi:hypothetical protein